MSDTDSADEPIEITLSPPRKRTKKSHLTVQTKEVILNVYKYEFQGNPALPLADIEQRAADKAGVPASSVFKIVKEYKDTHSLSGPKTHRNRKSSLDYVDDFDKNAIRRKIHGFFF